MVGIGQSPTATLGMGHYIRPIIVTVTAVHVGVFYCYYGRSCLQGVVVPNNNAYVILK